MAISPTMILARLRLGQLDSYCDDVIAAASEQITVHRAIKLIYPQLCSLPEIGVPRLQEVIADMAISELAMARRMLERFLKPWQDEFPGQVNCILVIFDACARGKS